MPGFIFTALLLLAFALVEGSLGPRGDHLTSLLAFVATMPIFLHLSRHSTWRGPHAGLLFMAAAGILLWYAAPGALRYLALTTALASLSLSIARQHEKTRQLASALTLTALGFALFVVVRDHLTLWPALEAASVRLSVALADWLGIAMRLGPTYSGFWFVIAFVIAFAARAIVVRRFDARVGVPALALVVLLAATTLVLRSFAPTHTHGIDLRVALGWRLLQFLAMLLPLALFMIAHPLRGEAQSTTRSTRTRLVPAVGAAIMLTGLVLLTWSARIQPRAGRVLLDTRGSFKMEPLVWDKYGPDAAGGASLATLPSLLGLHGFEFATCDTFIDAARLEQTDVLIVMNPMNDYTPAEFEAIWDFVEAGGGFLVLGDHTNIMGSMGPLNALLEPVGVRVEFDSAIPLVDRWTWYGCIRSHPHPLTRSIRDEADVKISVGASLALPRHALPLFTGRDAFSDAGDWQNAKGAYLGNMAYDRSETLGDLFLAAEVPYGRGKAIVYGDTSAFQRTAVFNTYELVARTMSYLSKAGSAVAPHAMRVAGASALLLGALPLVFSLSASLPVFLAACGLASAWLFAIDSRAVVELPQPTGQGDIAWVDVAHGNRVDVHTGVDHGIYGLTSHLWRQGFVPLAMNEFDVVKLQQAELFVTVAPAFPFTRRESQALRSFVENGGLLIISSGYEESAGAAALLAEFDYGIGRMPIGAAHEGKALLGNGSLFMKESWPVLHPEGRGEVWAECWGYPLIVFEKIGDGGLLVIGDSRFLLDANFESTERSVEPNIRFLRTAIDTARERMGSREP